MVDLPVLGIFNGNIVLSENDTDTLLHFKHLISFVVTCVNNSVIIELFLPLQLVS